MGLLCLSTANYVLSYLVEDCYLMADFSCNFHNNITVHQLLYFHILLWVISFELCDSVEISILDSVNLLVFIIYVKKQLKVFGI